MKLPKLYCRSDAGRVFMLDLRYTYNLHIEWRRHGGILFQSESQLPFTPAAAVLVWSPFLLRIEETKTIGITPFIRMLEETKTIGITPFIRMQDRGEPNPANSVLFRIEDLKHFPQTDELKEFAMRLTLGLPE